MFPLPVFNIKERRTNVAALLFVALCGNAGGYTGIFTYLHLYSVKADLLMDTFVNISWARVFPACWVVFAGIHVRVQAAWLCGQGS